MDFDRKNLRKIFLLIVGAILVYLGLQNMNIIFDFFYRMLYVLMPFIIAGCCTFFLNVPLKAIEKHLFRPKNGKPISEFKEKARRPLAIFISITIFAVIIGVFLTIIIPEIGKSLISLAESIPDSLNHLQDWLNEISNENQFIKDFVSELQINWEFISALINFFKNDAFKLFGSVIDMLSSIVSVTVNTALGVILSVYILMRKEKLSSDFKKILYSLLPMKTADYIVEVGHLANKSFYNCITGQMTECIILGTLTALGMTIFNFPYAALVGVLIAIMSWVPMFGVTIGICIGALFILTVNPVQAFWFIIFMICLQQIEGNFIYPRVVGSNIGLHPIFIISAIIIFGNLFGVIGLLIAVPVTSILYTIVRRFIYVRIKNREIPKEKYEIKKPTYKIVKTSNQKTVFLRKKKK